MMKICVISGTPKSDGLCQSIIDSAINGAEEAGAEVDVIKLCEVNLGSCKVCGDGWGKCRSDNRCMSEDGFNQVMARVDSCDAVIIATPVYWGEVTEALKNFMDRMRRCNFSQSGVLRNKHALLIASPGGSGNGMLTCLEQMERFCRHTGALIFDYIGVNRWNRDYKVVAAKAAAYAMAQGRRAGDSIV